MPPRGSEGLDFSPIFSHYVFLLTTVLAVLAWFIAFIGQCVTTAQHGRPLVSTLWFAIFLQLFLILGVLYTLASDSIAMHRLQISVFGAVAIAFAVNGAEGIFSDFGSVNAQGAGWLILAMVDIVWVLYFTSEEDSLTLHVFNSWGTGGLTPPSRRRRTRAPSVHDMNNGYNGSYASGGGIGNHDFENKMGGGLSNVSPSGLRSQHSFNAPVSDPGAGAKSLSGGSMRNAPIGNTTGSAGMDGPGSPLMGSNAQMSSAPSIGQQDSQQGDGFVKRAKAMYAYTASPDDPNEISFTKGEVLEIIDTQGKWWHAKKTDGTVGIAPSNYLQLI
jgi:SHO1 osmosensor